MKYLTIVFSLLLCCIMLFPAASFVAAGNGYVFGDVDGNGEVEVVDATWIQRHLVSIDIPFTIDLKTADIDGDGQIALIDATLIQRWLAHLKSNNKIGKIVNDPTQPTQDEYELPVV